MHTRRFDKANLRDPLKGLNLRGRWATYIVLSVFVSTFHSLSLCGGRGRSESACSFGKCRFTSLV